MEKGVWRFEIALGIFLFFFRRQPLEKGDWRFEVALRLFLYFFLGGNPWKKESADLRLLWDYFFYFFGWQAFGKVYDKYIFLNIFIFFK